MYVNLDLKGEFTVYSNKNRKPISVYAVYTDGRLGCVNPSYGFVMQMYRVAAGGEGAFWWVTDTVIGPQLMSKRLEILLTDGQIEVEGQNLIWVPKESLEDALAVSAQEAQEAERKRTERREARIDGLSKLVSKTKFRQGVAA